MASNNKILYNNHFRNRDRQRMSKVGEVQATLLRQAAKEEQEERERNRKANADDDSEEVDGEVRCHS